MGCFCRVNNQMLLEEEAWGALDALISSEEMQMVYVKRLNVRTH